jgi:thioredoxin 1
MLKHITEADFEKEVLQSAKPVLVDFFATWCGPCKMIAPILEEIASAEDSFDIAKIDIDEAEELCDKYGVMSVPTLIKFAGGEEAGRKIGLTSKQDLIDMMK